MSLFHSRTRAHLWRLATELIDVSFEPIDRFWEWQLELLRLQRAIQAEIGSAKEVRDIERLRNAQWLRQTSRQLGDAFAWVLLGADKPTIAALGKNRPVPIDPRPGISDKGTLELLRELASAGWGMPVLHDITNCLRIGDATFVNPANADHPFRTVELKATVLEQDDATNEVRIQVQVVEAWHEALGPRSDPKWATDVPLTPDEDRESSTSPPPVRRTRRPDRRLDKQLRRMEMALHARLAQDSVITKMPDDTSHLTVRASTKTTERPQIMRMIRSARREGYASALLDGVAMWAAVYDKTGVSAESFDDTTLLDHVRNSELSNGKHIGPEHLVVCGLPPTENWNNETVTPWLLVGFPKLWLKDLLYGRLMLFCIYSPSRMAAEVSELGLNLEYAPKSSGRGDYLMRTSVAGEREKWNLEFHVLSTYFHENTMEMRSLSDLGLLLSELATTAASLTTQVQATTATDDTGNQQLVGGSSE